MNAVADREQLIASIKTQPEWDLLVIGGGITGAGVMLRAAQQGQRVLLLEQQDFAWGTSSRSSKMVHGGLRYLVNGDFALTRESVRERELLMTELEGLVEPMSYVYAHYRGRWVERFGLRMLLKLYDRFAKRVTHKALSIADTLMLLPGLRASGLVAATQFEDAVTDDARLVLRTIDEAEQQGGIAINYLKAMELIEKEGRIVGLKAEDQVSKMCITLNAKCVVNASGAWVSRLWGRSGGIENDRQQQVRPLRGSHLVLPGHRLPIGSVLTMPHPRDGRSVFIFPWDQTTVVGTTDLDHEQPMDREASITADEFDYLLTCVQDRFPDLNLQPEEVLSTWAGVRPVISEGEGLSPSDEKREHACWAQPGLVSVSGGKLTTFRVIADQVLELVRQQTKPSAGNSSAPSLFGINQLPVHPAGIGGGAWKRLHGRYGKRLDQWWSHHSDQRTLGNTPTLLSELYWAAAFQKVVHLDDLLLRRTRVGLQLPEGAALWLPQVRQLCQPLLGWSNKRWEQEEQRYRAIIDTFYSLPAGVKVSQVSACLSENNDSVDHTALPSDASRELS
ncbi:glycerol-3-phosphate dehydrogenase/oxidase [Aestuariirhabdus sp. Z084]|uniref:glycerol-3-phosphate dehydrogenase/oxidase n=1 Tax=Aestuariirhabdus haliotis TaxID=2918751 RepID=UPI00201B3568|nr:glycerol-3-phosphate dehydrogenase/oxidase [Aestuariirhabdus haliotis]MCL6414738.1 glycerol-3-phosphate dehydrogenase/oxidase [Aestuariirhabdus haliotis]MCL6418670.1 glycerol-3-phosphate dehydrogenase/oxidase [Aestuariirhabdus haliotis]